MKEKAFYKVGHEFCFTHVQVYFDCRSPLLLLLLRLLADFFYIFFSIYTLLIFDKLYDSGFGW